MGLDIDAQQPATDARRLWPWFGLVALLSGLGTLTWLIPLPVTMVLVIATVGVAVFEAVRAKRARN